MAKTGFKPESRTCANPLCLKQFTAKRGNQAFCSGTCRQAVFMAKKDRVIKAAESYILRSGPILTLAEKMLPEKRPVDLEIALQLRDAVCDLNGWDKNNLELYIS